MQGRVIKVSGPLVIVEGLENAKMADVVKVGKIGLIGEIIELKGDQASVQVYEETSGIGPEDPVENTGAPLSVELGPGLMGSIYDGIQRPLSLIEKQSGFFMGRGISVPAISRTQKWEFKPLAKVGEEVVEGDVLGEVDETQSLKHKVMVPLGLKGKIIDIKPGKFTVEETIATLETKDGKKEIRMLQKWPVRKSRAFAKKLPVTQPLQTGQRIIDSLFTLGKGGTAAIPGPFGSGKTVIQHQLAKWANVDVVIFIGCGERGNEMTDVLKEFPQLKDPKTNRPLMERTILIANTSNMPIAAREASVYTGAALAEYYRDMGYDVALMADSTSRWAEALREMSGRLEEMPGEEGYPAYLGSRISEFYERSGYGIVNGSKEKTGSLSIIGSVSPPGGDLSEPVVQNTLRVTKVFWGLDYKLAYQRHFPAINWLISYSLYHSNIEGFLREKVAASYPEIIKETLKILSEEAELEEIVRLVGLESLSTKEQLTLFCAKQIREDFLYQSARDEIDQYASLKKQYQMLFMLQTFRKLAEKSIQENISLSNIQKLACVEKITKMRFIPEKQVEKDFKALADEIKKDFTGLK